MKFTEKIINYIQKYPKIKLIFIILYRFIKDPNVLLFYVHNAVINIIYGSVKDYQVFDLSFLKDDLDQVFLGKDLKFRDLSRSDKFLLISKFYGNENSKVEEELDKNLILKDFDYNLAIQIQSKIRTLLSSYVNSPFCFVNSRAWITKPGSELYGPNDMHVDGFYSGHLKIMIYTSELNEDSGYLIIGNSKLNSLKKYTGIAFKNSDIFHSGIPGKLNNRNSIEFTIFRSFINNNQFNYSHYNGRHYKNIFVPYLKKCKLLKQRFFY